VVFLNGRDLRLLEQRLRYLKVCCYFLFFLIHLMPIRQKIGF